jgi:hypothetical protein
VIAPERPERLIAMANQIARFFDAQRGDAAASTLGHLKGFWDPQMRREIVAWSRSGGTGLSPTAAEAVRRLEAETQPG